MSDFLKQVKQAGVVGAGGAGFPAYVKLDCQVEYVLVNGAECEPLLNKDQILLQRYTIEMLAGIKLAMQHTGATQCFIGIKAKHADSIEIVQQHLTKLGDTSIKILAMDDVYPAGDEVELIYEAIGRRIPSGGLPKDIGVMVHNVETFINIYYATQNIPVTKTMVTVHGEVQKPYTAWLPIGLSYAEAIALAGGVTCSDFVVIDGGPMMGSATDDLGKSIKKVSSGLIVIKKESNLATIKLRTPQELLRIGKAACDQCSLCTSMCPRNLLGFPVKPHLAMRALQLSSPDNVVGSIDAQVCSECNLCSMWSCPEGLDPKNVCRLSKQTLRAQNLLLTPHQLQEKTIDVSPMRAYRKVPTKRLIQRLGLASYAHHHADFIEFPFFSKEVKIPLSQHIGAPAVACIKVGDKVNEGQVIGQAAENALSVNIHASMTGTVTEVSNYIVIKTA